MEQHLPPLAALAALTLVLCADKAFSMYFPWF